ncbi:MAG: PilN domain-containing protein [Lysobacterales bacterium]
MAGLELDRWFAPYLAAYRRSTVHRFLHWWGGELASYLPPRFYDWFVERRDEVQVRQDADGWHLQRLGSHPIASETVAPDAAAETLRAHTDQMLGVGETGADLVALLPESQVLTRRLNLPMAAEENLAQVIGFELDRQTPFKPDQVRHDFRVISRDLAGRQIQVEVLIALRARADALVAPVQAAGLALDALDALAADGSRRGFNLLPPEARASRVNRGARLNAILAAVAVLLLWAVMNQSLDARRVALDRLQSAVDKERAEAASTGQLQQRLTDAVEGANFLDQRKREQPVVVDILRELTALLPLDTSLMRLSVNRGDVQIQGTAEEAAQLIVTLQKAKTIESPGISGAITPDARSKKEQFLIQAKARLPNPREGKHATATKP